MFVQAGKGRPLLYGRGSHKALSSESDLASSLMLVLQGQNAFSKKNEVGDSKSPSEETSLYCKETP